MLLLIFSNLDARTLFKSCSLVCREWYQLFFDPSLDHESFRKSLLKIVYLNDMSQKMQLKHQWNHSYSQETYSHFDDIKSILLKNNEQSLTAFSQLLIKTEKKKKKPSSRKYLTINSVCELIPMIRHPERALKLSTENSELLRKHREDAKLPSFPLTHWKFKLKEDCGFSICHYLMAHTFSVLDTKLCLDITCTLTQKSLLSTPISVASSKSSIIVLKIEMTYHPQFQKQYKKKFNIDGKRECYIYSVYLLYQSDRIFYLKKYLICDYLSGNVDYLEDVSNFLKPMKLHNHIYGDKTQFSFHIGEWDSHTFDIVLFIDHVFQIVYVCVENMCLCGFTSIVHKKVDPLYAPLQVIPFETFSVSSRPLVDAIAFNFTKAFQQEGVTLANPEKYSDFVVLEIKMACHEMVDGLEGHLYAEKFYTVIAKKVNNNNNTICKEHDTSSPYSILWKRFSQFLIYKEQTFKRWYDHGECEVCAKFIDQGRLLQFKGDHTEALFNYYGYYDEAPIFKFVSHSWNIESISYSPCLFPSQEERTSMLILPKHLILESSSNMEDFCRPSFDRAMYKTTQMEVLTFDANCKCALRLNEVYQRYELVFY